MGATRSDKTNLKFQSGAAFGSEFSIMANSKIGLVGALEGRSLLSSDFNPNPVWSLVLRLEFKSLFNVIDT